MLPCIIHSEALLPQKKTCLHNAQFICFSVPNQASAETSCTELYVQDVADMSMARATAMHI